MSTATLTVEHGDKESSAGGGSAYIPRNFMVDRFIEQCRTNPKIKNRLLQNPQLLNDVVDAYIGGQIERLFLTRNAGMARSGKRSPGGGPQTTLFTKNLGLAMTGYMARVLGPYALTDDEVWGLENSLFEVCERAGLCIAPGGTPEALKIVISRGLRIGR